MARGRMGEGSALFWQWGREGDARQRLGGYGGGWEMGTKLGEGVVVGKKI